MGRSYQGKVEVILCYPASEGDIVAENCKIVKVLDGKLK